MATHSLTLTIERCGIEIDLDCEIAVESYGYGSNGWDDPGEGPEWYAERIRTAEAGIVLDHDRDLTDAEQAQLAALVDERVDDWQDDAAEAWAEARAA